MKQYPNKPPHQQDESLKKGKPFVKGKSSNTPFLKKDKPASNLLFTKNREQQNDDTGSEQEQERPQYQQRRYPNPHYQSGEGGEGGNQQQRPYQPRRYDNNRPQQEGGGEGNYQQRPYQPRRYDNNRPQQGGGGYESRPRSNNNYGQDRNRGNFQRDNFDRPQRKRFVRSIPAPEIPEDLNPQPSEWRLNRYLSNAGICARRKADEHIANGEVQVNGNVVTEMGYKVKPEDEVRFRGEVIIPNKKVYVLFNKPKDVICTTHDPEGRRTVLDCLGGVRGVGLFPVGRLDRNTTGLLLITNDGDLAQKLSHPSNEVHKVYYVLLDRDLETEDIEQIRNGVELEEGIAQVDDIQYAQGSRCEVGIELHIGWNRVVRRIFEKLGYRVKRLDRVLYANLSKRDLPRSKWRYLMPQEVITLKHMNLK